MSRPMKILALSLLACLAGLPASVSRSDDGNRHRPSLLVPAYIYPGGPGLEAWQQLAKDARTTNVEIILNPASGPGEKRNPSFVKLVGNIRKAGGKVLGYVPTKYGKRDLAEVERDVRTYLKFYEVDGFLLDEMAGTKEFLPYYRKTHRLIKELQPALRIVANPGQPYIDEGYMKTADCLLLFEGNPDAFAKYKPLVPSPWIKRYPPNRFGVTVHTVRTAADMRRTIEQANQTRAGWVFITDRLMPNPYDALPTYWDEEVRECETRPAASQTRT